MPVINRDVFSLKNDLILIRADFDEVVSDGIITDITLVAIYWENNSSDIVTIKFEWDDRREINKKLPPGKGKIDIPVRFQKKLKGLLAKPWRLSLGEP